MDGEDIDDKERAIEHTPHQEVHIVQPLKSEGAEQGILSETLDLSNPSSYQHVSEQTDHIYNTSASFAVKDGSILQDSLHGYHKPSETLPTVQKTGETSKAQDFAKKGQQTSEVNPEESFQSSNVQPEEASVREDMHSHINNVTPQNVPPNSDVETKLKANPRIVIPTIVQHENHGKSLLEKFKTQKELSRFCDVVLVLQNRKYPAHSCVLAACSSYFDAILKQTPSMIAIEQISIDCEDHVAFEALLDYIYSGQVIVTEDNIFELQRLAKLYIFNELSQGLTEFIKRNFSNAGYLDNDIESLAPDIEEKTDHQCMKEVQVSKEKQGMVKIKIKDENQGDSSMSDGKEIVKEPPMKKKRGRKKQNKKQIEKLVLKIDKDTTYYDKKDNTQNDEKDDSPNDIKSEFTEVEDDNNGDDANDLDYDINEDVQASSTKRTRKGRPKKIATESKIGKAKPAKMAYKLKRKRQVKTRIVKKARAIISDDSATEIDEEYVNEDNDDTVEAAEEKKAKKLKKREKSNRKAHRSREAGQLVSCTECEYKTRRKDHMKRHVQTRHSEDSKNKNRSITCTCKVCANTFSNRLDLNEHYKLHFTGPPFICDIEDCDYTTDKISMLLNHRVRHTGVKPCVCPLCQASFWTPSNLTTHMKRHSGDKSHACDQCGDRFYTRQELQAHCQKHSQVSLWLCDSCGFSTKHQTTMMRHKRIHTGDVFRCAFPECTYSTPKRSLLDRHTRFHLGIRSFVCTTCGMGFVDKSNLIRHEKTHLPDKPIKCEQCEFACSRKDKLTEHMRKHHSELATVSQPRKRQRQPFLHYSSNPVNYNENEIKSKRAYNHVSQVLKPDEESSVPKVITEYLVNKPRIANDNEDHKAESQVVEHDSLNQLKVESAYMEMPHRDVLESGDIGVTMETSQVIGPPTMLVPHHPSTSLPQQYIPTVSTLQPTHMPINSPSPQTGPPQGVQVQVPAPQVQQGQQAIPPELAAHYQSYSQMLLNAGYM
ncbi:unnamed protein product [Owenia fusiformis]|uniref:Uncharacterized protein n=1 Tax=Owenia fusiformis TaxID=6347 RepID=A0A8J1YA00_OWEFU|nr:unnamed protein product [Owenia fusiformis]